MSRVVDPISLVETLAEASENEGFLSAGFGEGYRVLRSPRINLADGAQIITMAPPWMRATLIACFVEVEVAGAPAGGSARVCEMLLNGVQTTGGRISVTGANTAAGRVSVLTPNAEITATNVFVRGDTLGFSIAAQGGTPFTAGAIRIVAVFRPE